MHPVQPYLRRAGLDIQTPVITYVNPDRGGVITFVAAQQFGELEYYARLQERVEGLAEEGAVVQAAGPRLVVDARIPTSDESEVLLDLHRLWELDQRAATALGLSTADRALGHRPGWQTVDLSDLEILRRVGMPVTQKYLARRARLFRDIDYTPKKRQRLQLKVQTERWTAAKRGVAGAALPRSLGQVMAYERGMYAAGFALETGGDLVMVREEQHLIAVDQALGDAGFTCVKTEWETAMTLLPWRSAIWRAI